MKLYVQKGFPLVKRGSFQEEHCKKWQKVQNACGWHSKCFKGNKLETQRTNIYHVSKGF